MALRCAASPLCRRLAPRALLAVTITATARLLTRWGVLRMLLLLVMLSMLYDHHCMSCEDTSEASRANPTKPFKVSSLLPLRLT